MQSRKINRTTIIIKNKSRLPKIKEIKPLYAIRGFVSREGRKFVENLAKEDNRKDDIQSRSFYLFIGLGLLKYCIGLCPVQKLL
jgi:hypothetical protein